ncbi:ABC transporter ATP-binding protein [Isoptericola croceus]|uniref:ABC transporter ATP-binding protein n=1 Tax=Isoptericola croceus TaxID=3031406 RepID=UPI0023F725F9|nr:ATP-binding cassette domain-containing protein [Isoptericola croceus]
MSVIVRSLRKVYGHRVLFDRLSFDIASGEVLALTGASGTGKSTLLNCLGLLEAPSSGRIMVAGRSVSDLGSRAARLVRRDVLGYLFQNYALVENADVNFNVQLADGGVRRRVQRADVDSALERVGLSGRGRDPIHQMSGGEQQRVALARLIVRRPAVILADEPTGALDTVNADMVIATLHELASDGATVVVATHDESVSRSCNRILDLDAVRNALTVPAPPSLARR